MSTIAVGDPCQIRPVWSADLPQNSDFCEPTIADGRVYMSSDEQLSAFDLATGQLIGSVSGLPYILGGNRGNVTVHNGQVFVTGGSGQTISKWDADLQYSAWVNGSGSGIGPLGADVGFGVTAVYDINGTEVVVIGTEAGHLWCLETSNGTLFSGWPTNPVILDQGILHSPAYDGDDLYVGTSSMGYFGPGVGSIYRLDAATGAIVWNWSSPLSYSSAYSSGLSLDGEHIYATSVGPATNGQRTKLTKDGDLLWRPTNYRSLYGPPAYDQNYLYIPQDGAGGGGVLQVDKHSGSALYNFASNGVGRVTQHVTLSCDGYLFAGDRLGNWWVINISSKETTKLYQSPFGANISGTALATDPLSGENYAVVTAEYGNPTNGAGRLLAFQLNAGYRPRVQQSTFEVEIKVPLGASSSNSHNEPDVLTNIGCDILEITSYTVTELTIDPASHAYSKAYAAYAENLANVIVGDDYVSYFNDAKISKRARQSRAMIDGERTRGDVALERAAQAMFTSKRRTQQLQAEANAARTTNVTYSSSITPGDSTDVSWDWDGTGLARGIDIEVIELITNDPDLTFLDRQPTITIRYVNGCDPDSVLVSFGDDPPDKSEYLYNNGQIGWLSSNYDLVWEGVAGHLYDGGFILCGEYLTGSPDQAQFHSSFLDGGGGLPTWPGTFLPDVRPSDESCNFDGELDVHLGYKRVDGCPGTAQEIRGEWARSYYIDVNWAVPSGSFELAVGVEIEQTEIGAHDVLYGDFKLICWTLHNRDAVEKTLHCGSIMDWDAGDYALDNRGLVSDLFNGYAIWNSRTPTVAFGMLEPRMITDFATVDPAPHAPHRIHVMLNYTRLWHDFGGPFDDLTESAERMWRFCVEYEPTREVDRNPWGLPLDDDYTGLLINEPITLPANGTADVFQVLFGVDATSDIEANAVELAERAAKWAGFARGDVNDDGAVDVLDVCWLMSGEQLYPDDYNGDVDLSGNVDLADQQYLLDYVSGLGPAPEGEWRFTF